MFAGAMDAVGGGGGLVSVPALLAAGLPPHLALGTNKGQSVFGSLAALARYAHAGLVDTRAARYAFPLAVAGSIAGVLLTLSIRPDALRPIVLVLLVVAGVVVLTIRAPERREPGERVDHAAERWPGIGRRGDWIWAGAALVIGGYDGFFGPGAGTFLILVLVTLLHRSLTRATADAKVANLGSNLAAAVVFGLRGAVVWHVALPMAAAQLVGGFLGAHLAVRRGDRLIRGVVALVVLALLVKVARDMFARGG